MAETSVSTPTKSKLTSTQKELLLFLSIPAAVIAIVLLVIFLPSQFARPQYDFIYSYCPAYDCSSDIVVGHDGIARQMDLRHSTYTYGRNQSLKIYYHDMKQNASRRIEVSELSNYKLDPTNVSPDGYALTKGSNGGDGFLLWSNSYDDSWTLKKGFVKKSLRLELDDYYSQDLDLIGWVRK